MPDREEKKSYSERNMQIAKNKSVLRAIVSQILDESKETGIKVDEFEPTNPAGLTRTEVFYYYAAHDFDVPTREPLLTLGKIAEIVIPDSFDKSETISKEIVSAVGQEMLRRYLVRKEIEMYGIGALTSERMVEIEEDVELFNDQRNVLVRQKHVIENPTHYSNLIRVATESSGKHNWTEEEKNRLYDLMKICIWPKGAFAPGKTNWGEVARILSEEFNADFTRKQVKDIVGTRRRNAKKKGLTLE